MVGGWVGEGGWGRVGGVEDGGALGWVAELLCAILLDTPPYRPRNSPKRPLAAPPNSPPNTPLTPQQPPNTPLLTPKPPQPPSQDVLYTLEVNSFKDGLLRAKDHAGKGGVIGGVGWGVDWGEEGFKGGAVEQAPPNLNPPKHPLPQTNTCHPPRNEKTKPPPGVGLLLSRMAEGGDPRKGPHSVGLRIQDTLRVGPLRVEAVAAQVGAVWLWGVGGVGGGRASVFFGGWRRGCLALKTKQNNTPRPPSPTNRHPPPPKHSPPPTKVRGEAPMGGKDEAWGSRAFLVHDALPVGWGRGGAGRGLGEGWGRVGAGRGICG